MIKHFGFQNFFVFLFMFRTRKKYFSLIFLNEILSHCRQNFLNRMLKLDLEVGEKNVYNFKLSNNFLQIEENYL